MRVDARFDRSQANQSYRNAAGGSEPAGFSVALVAAKAADGTADGTVKAADFTGMTRQDLKDWINTQIRSGAMSFDESSTFVGMTLNGIEVGASAPTEDDGVQFDYMQIMRAGIEGARFRRDPAEILRLEKALQTMQQHRNTV